MPWRRRRLKMKRFCKLSPHPDRQRALMQERASVRNATDEGPEARVLLLAAKRSAYAFHCLCVFAMASDACCVVVAAHAGDASGWGKAER